MLPQLSRFGMNVVVGYHVQEDGETERILPAGITERFARGADGTLAPLTAGSTQWFRRVTTAE
jgi:hypothetical protein